MKRLFLIIAMSVFTSNAIGQEHKLFIYGKLGGGYGNFTSFNIGLNVIYTDYIFAINYSAQHADADNVPSDYQAGLDILGDGKPWKTLNTTDLEAGRVFYTKDVHVRFIIQGGISLGGAVVPDTYTRIPAPPFLGSNYDISYRNIPVVGLILNPSIELPLGAGLGFAGGLFWNINTANSSFGMGGKYLVW